MLNYQRVSHGDSSKTIPKSFVASPQKPSVCRHGRENDLFRQLFLDDLRQDLLQPKQWHLAKMAPPHEYIWFITIIYHTRVYSYVYHVHIYIYIYIYISIYIYIYIYICIYTYIYIYIHMYAWNPQDLFFPTSWPIKCSSALLSRTAAAAHAGPSECHPKSAAQ